MAKYMFQATYTAGGAKGVLKDGGSARRAAIEALVSGMGGPSSVFTSPLAAMMCT